MKKNLSITLIFLLSSFLVNAQNYIPGMTVGVLQDNCGREAKPNGLSTENLTIKSQDKLATVIDWSSFLTPNDPLIPFATNSHFSILKEICENKVLLREMVFEINGTYHCVPCICEKFDLITNDKPSEDLIFEEFNANGEIFRNGDCEFKFSKSSKKLSEPNISSLENKINFTNPINQGQELKVTGENILKTSIFDLSGRLVFFSSLNDNERILLPGNINTGVYIIVFEIQNMSHNVISKILIR